MVVVVGIVETVEEEMEEIEFKLYLIIILINI